MLRIIEKENLKVITFLRNDFIISDISSHKLTYERRPLGIDLHCLSTGVVLKQFGPRLSPTRRRT